MQLSHFMPLPRYPLLLPPRSEMAVVNGMLLPDRDIPRVTFYHQHLASKYPHGTRVQSVEGHILWAKVAGPARTLTREEYSRLWFQHWLRASGYTNSRVPSVVIKSGHEVSTIEAWKAYTEVLRLCENDHTLFLSFIKAVISSDEEVAHERSNVLGAPPYDLTHSQGIITTRTRYLVRSMIVPAKGPDGSEPVIMTPLAIRR